LVLLLIVGSTSAPAEDVLRVTGISGRPGGRLVYGERTEPKTLNPIFAADAASRDVLSALHADLVHINRATLRTEPALAKSYKVSPDHLHYELELRRGLRFSDGHPFDADDVLFTFQVFLDPKVDAPQRSLWVLDGKPITVRKLGAYAVAFDLPRVNAVGERIFDSVPMLPRHLLEAAYRDGKLAEAWPLRVAPQSIAGLGPFRLKEYISGQRIVLERNPWYWKSDEAGNRLPYVSELVFPFSAGEDLQILRFQSGESDVVNRIAAKDYEALKRQPQADGLTLQDAGPGFEYSFLFFNLTDTAPRSAAWRRGNFRKAVSLAVDREAILRLVYHGFASPLAVPVPAGNRLWINQRVPPPARSLDSARRLLQADGFRWSAGGALEDAEGHAVEFTIAASSSNAERMQMATLIQADLRQLGVQVQVVPLEFRSLVDRVLRTHDFEACIFALSSPDADPNADLQMWLSSGSMHVWNPEQPKPATAWESEIDSLMQQQLITPQPEARKRIFDRVQEIGADQMPVIPLVTPHLLAGAKRALANFRPAAIEPFALWNVETLYWQVAGNPPRR
jgi:peptide/nickel transport system substrate-binding protein